jgi:hypothetical protein
MAECWPVAMPLQTKHALSSAQSLKNSEEWEKYEEYAQGIHYLALIGSLLYTTQTRPNIQFAVSLVA